MFPMLHLHFNCWCRRLRVAVPTVAKSSFTRTCRTHAHTHTHSHAQRGTQTIAQLCRAHQPQVRVSHFHCMKIPTTSNQVEGENPALWAHLLMPQLPVAVVVVVCFPLRQQIKRKSATFRTLTATEGSKTGRRCC